MKVLNLRCAHGHGFEGWFGSEEDFQGQAARGLVECPSCGDRLVTKLPSAPRLNLSGAREPALPPDGTRPDTARAPSLAQPVPEALVELQQLWRAVTQHVLHNTVDVGDRFAEEARRIHYGEAEMRGIRGQTTAQERESLAEEGIEVMAMPLPIAPEGSLQ